MFEALLTNRTVSVLWEALPRILTAGLTMIQYMPALYPSILKMRN